MKQQNQRHQTKLKVQQNLTVKLHPLIHPLPVFLCCFFSIKSILTQQTISDTNLLSREFTQTLKIMAHNDPIIQ